MHLQISHLTAPVIIRLQLSHKYLKNLSTVSQAHYRTISSAILSQSCPAIIPISLCAANKQESPLEDSATSATANALFATLTYDLPLLFASATSAPSETIKTNALSAAAKASATHFTASSALGWRRTVMDAPRLSISAHQGPTCSTRRRISEIIELC